jgi:arabinofuranan 3-O-arabinosyltransferase
VVSTADTRQVLRVGSGPAALLRTSRNFNDGWRAELGGTVLAPQRVDGWAQGWRVPSGTGGTLVVTYAPQRPYLVGLVTGLVLAGLLLVLAVVVLVRTRLREPAYSGERVQRLQPVTRRRRRRGRAVPVAFAATGLGWVLGGVPVAAGVLLVAALLAAGRRGAVLPLAGALLAAAPLVAALRLAEHRVTLVTSADLLAGTGVAMALALLLLDATRRRED